MNRKEIEERKRIMALEQDYSEQIIEVKQEMYKSGKRFYTCSVGAYQLIIISTSTEQLVHTFIPNLEFISVLTK